MYEVKGADDGLNFIVLRKSYNKKGKYMGMSVIPIECLTPTFLGKIRADKDNKMGWKQYRKVMKKAGYPIESRKVMKKAGYPVERTS